MGCSRQEDCSRLAFLPPGDLLDSGMKPAPSALLHWQADFLSLTTGEPLSIHALLQNNVGAIGKTETKTNIAYVCTCVYCVVYTHTHMYTHIHKCTRMGGVRCLFSSHTWCHWVCTHKQNIRKTVNTEAQEPPRRATFKEQGSGLLWPSSLVCTGRIHGASCSRQAEGLGLSRHHSNPFSGDSSPTPQYFKTDSRETHDKRWKWQQHMGGFRGPGIRPLGLICLTLPILF